MDNLRAFGAKVVVCPTNVDPEDPRSYYKVSKRLARQFPIVITSISTIIYGTENPKWTG